MDARQYIMLTNHLQYNFYPPIWDESIWEICEQVINRVNAGGREERDLRIVEEFHLEFFVEDSLLTDE